MLLLQNCYFLYKVCLIFLFGRCNIFIVNLNKKYSVKEYNYYEINDEINIESIEETGIFYIININCIKTKNDSCIFTVKNIV